MNMDRVDRQPVTRRGRERLVDPVLVDPEFRRPDAAVGELVVVAGAGTRVDPEPDRSWRQVAGRQPPAEPLNLADRVEVQVDRLDEDGVEVAIGQVGRGDADLGRGPAALDGAAHLTGRAGVDPDQRPEDLEHARVRIGLQGEPEAGSETCSDQRRRQAIDVLGQAPPVVHKERGSLLASERLGVRAGDDQPAVDRLEPLAMPPWGDAARDRAGGRVRSPPACGVDGHAEAAGRRPRPEPGCQ